MTLERLISIFKSWFNITQMISEQSVPITLAVTFGIAAAWLAGYWPPFIKKWRLWLVLVAGALVTVTAATFIEVPLRYYVSQGLSLEWVIEGETSAFQYRMILYYLPMLLIGGAVQVGAKMLPVVFWRRADNSITPKMGLIIGAVSGAGYGIMAVMHKLNLLPWLDWGSTTTTMTSMAQSIEYGFLQNEGICLIWQSFFIVGFHIAISALAGYGLAKGKGWLFYLIAIGVHIAFYMGEVLEKAMYFYRPLQTHMYMAAFALVLTAFVLLLRWRKDSEELLEEPVKPVEPEISAVEKEPSG